jgi:glutaredoxin
MRTRKAASSEVVGPLSRFARLAVYAALGIAFVGASSLGTGCKKKDDVSAESAIQTPVVKDLTDGLQLTWIDEKGEFHVEQRVADVPATARDVVRVRVLESTVEPPGDRVFVADLRNAKDDGSYPVQAVPRAQFEDLAVARRTKTGTAVLAPKAAASVAAANSAGAGTSGDVAGRPAVIIYGASWCGPCHQAAAYLKQKGVAFVEHDIEQDSVSQHEMQAKLAKAGMRGGSIPVLDVRGHILVGFDARAVDQALGTAL